MAYGDIMAGAATQYMKSGGKASIGLNIVGNMLAEREKKKALSEKVGMILLQHGPIAKDVYGKMTGTPLPMYDTANEALTAANHRLTSIMNQNIDKDFITEQMVDDNTKQLFMLAGLPLKFEGKGMPNKAKKTANAAAMFGAFADALGGGASGESSGGQVQTADDYIKNNF